MRDLAQRLWLVGVLGLGVTLSASNCGSSKPTCSARTCATGCCDALGACQGGFLAQACGTNGNLCNVCAPGTTCEVGACVTPITGGGTGGGVAGGFSGGTGGGVSGGSGGGSAGGSGGGFSGGTGGGFSGGTGGGFSGGTGGGFSGGTGGGFSGGTGGGFSGGTGGGFSGGTGGGFSGGTGGGFSGGTGGGFSGGTGGGFSGGTGGGFSGGTGGGFSGGTGGGGFVSCTPTSCASGCCSATGSCVTPPTTSRCGKNGAACLACPSRNTCVTGACTPCGGCVDLTTGQCLAGNTNGSCGASGAFCSVCNVAAGQSCVGGICQSAGTCNPSTCSDGCCDGNSCLRQFLPDGGSEWSNGQCGSGSAGAACQGCFGGETCDLLLGTCSGSGGGTGGGGGFFDGGTDLCSLLGSPCVGGCCELPFILPVCTQPGQPCILTVGTCDGASGLCQ